ncbi:MAG: hypothetical protein ACR2H0_01255, partial [Candidatus Limnocylindrales bacterium]
QSDLAIKASVTRSDISRLERGKAAELRVEIVLRIVAALGGRLGFSVWWFGGELDRLLNARHAALHESVARSLLMRPGWAFAPEASFSIRGERGVIDILAWHGDTRTLLVVELKTEIVDISDLMGSVDRKRRLAASVARDRGWIPSSVSVWVIVGECVTNRRRVLVARDHAACGVSLRRPCDAILASIPVRWHRLPVFLVDRAGRAR